MLSLDLTAALLALRSQKTGDPITVIDGGCHTGAFSQLVLDQFPQAHILAFEPDPVSWQHAEKKFLANPAVTIVEAALGAKNTQAEFFRGPLSATNSLLPRPQMPTKPYFPKNAQLSGGTDVSVTSLDTAAAHFKHINILKLDLQGGELAALEGAAYFLENASIDIIITEVVFVQKYKNQPLFWQIWQHLDTYDYSFHSGDDLVVGLYHQEPSSPRQQQWNQADAIFLSPKMRQALDG